MSRPVRNKASAGLVALLLLAALPARAAEDPFAGTWVSRPDGRAPGADHTQMTISIEFIDNTLHYRSRSVKPDGRVAVAEYTGAFDGRAVTVVGSNGLLVPVSLARLDAHNISASYLRGMQVVATSRWVITRDGSHMTITTQSPDARKVQTQTVLRLVRASEANRSS